MRSGLTTATVITTDMALIIPYVAVSAITGIALSITPTCFENLEMIVPLVVESKKRILARITFSVILLCIFVLAFIIRSCKVIDLKTPKTIMRTILPTKRIIHVLSFYCSSIVSEVQRTSTYDGAI